MKSTRCIHLNLLIERGVERAKLKKLRILDREYDMKLILKTCLKRTNYSLIQQADYLN